jgi:Ca2+-transporting ATPase
VTNGVPALALGVDPPDETQRREPPRRRTAGLLGPRDWLGMAFVGLWMGAAAMICYFIPGSGQADVIHGRAMAFSLLALSPLFHAFNCRSATASFLSLYPIVPRALAAAVIASAAIHLFALLVPAVRPVFQTFTMSARESWALILLSASVVPAVEAMKALQRVMARRVREGQDWLGPLSRRGD